MHRTTVENRTNSFMMDNSIHRLGEGEGGQAKEGFSSSDGNGLSNSQEAPKQAELLSNDFILRHQVAEAL